MAALARSSSLFAGRARARINPIRTEGLPNKDFETRVKVAGRPAERVLVSQNFPTKAEAPAFFESLSDLAGESRGASEKRRGENVAYLDNRDFSRIPVQRGHDIYARAANRKFMLLRLRARARARNRFARKVSLS